MGTKKKSIDADVGEKEIQTKRGTQNKVSNISAVVQKYEDAGWECVPVRVDSQDFAVPQSRKRIFFLCLRPCEKFLVKVTGTGFDDLFNAITASIKAMKMRPPNLSDIMLEPDSHHVFNEMDRQLAIAMKRTDNDDWQDRHIEFLTSKGIRINAPTLAKSTETSPWVATLPEREKAVLKYAQYEKKGPCSVDLSQSPGRLSFVKIGVHGGQVAPTLIEHTHLWLHSQDPERPMLGREALTLQAFPWQRLDAAAFDECEFTDRFLADLAGNAYTCSVMLAIMCSIFIEVEWHKENERSHDSNIIDALEALCGSDEDEDLDDAEHDDEDSDDATVEKE